MSGGGTLEIGAGATLFVGGAVGSGVSAVFAGVGGTLILYAASGGFAETISGFAAGRCDRPVRAGGDRGGV